jgi:hypothetical protein
VLLLDEPLGALDLKLRKEMQFELKQVQSQDGGLASGETLTARLQNVAGRGFGEFAIGDQVRYQLGRAGYLRAHRWRAAAPGRAS